MTTETDALVERLDAMYSHRGDGIPTQYVNPDGPAAIDAIIALRARVAALEEGLRPFARIAERGKYGGSFVIARAIYEDGDAAPRESYWHWSDFAAARALLGNGGGET